MKKKTKKAELESLVKFLIWVVVVIIGVIAVNFGYKLIKSLVR